MSTQRGAPNTERSDLMGTFGTAVSRERQDSTVTVLAIDLALAEMEIPTRPSDIVAKAASIENAIIQSRTRRKRGQVC